MFNKPQAKVLCFKILTLSPKKPNSANRRIIKGHFAKGFKPCIVKIRGEGHTLQQHSNILVQVAKIKDLIGVSLSAVRGKYDLAGVKNRKNARSLYGVKLKLTV